MRYVAVTAVPGLLRLISSRWAPATSTNQGTRELFSTGSQAQNPPKLRAS